MALRDLEVALAVLTRLPSRLGAPPGPRELAAAVLWFPLAGALVGAIAGAAYFLAGSVGLPGLSALLVALAVQLLLTGALHEIGTAHTVEAVCEAGGGPAAASRRHAATLALGLLLLTRVAALTSFWSPAAFAAALIAASAVSRAALPALLWAERHAQRVRPEPGRVALACGLALAIGLALLPPFLALQAALWAGLAGAATGLWLSRRLGGCDGHALGAVQQVCELAFLWALAAEGWPREG